MADYLLHNAGQFKDATVLELGGGSGLVSIVAAMVSARRVICTGRHGNVPSPYQLSLASVSVPSFMSCVHMTHSSHFVF